MNETKSTIAMLEVIDHLENIYSELHQSNKETEKNRINNESQNTMAVRETISCLENIYSELRRYNEEAEKIKLNVVLITYNHEKYIRESLKSIIEQCTNFKFNIIVADDCSTDKTLEIIKSIEAETDIPFIYLQSGENLGIKKNYKRAFEACTAEYVAIMEGDDIWHDPYRLQKHFSFMNEHLECSMSFNQYIVKNFEKNEMHVQPLFFAEKGERYRIITGHDLAYDNLIGNFSTCVYRTAYLKKLPKRYHEIFAYDWLLNILMSQMGCIGCLLQPMSIYRIHGGSVWSSQNELEKTRALHDIIDEYDEMTNREFTEGFRAYKNRLADMIKKAEPVPEAPDAQDGISNIVPESQQEIANQSMSLSLKRKLKKAIIAFRKLCCKLSDAVLPPLVTKLIMNLVPPRVIRKIVSMREN